MNLTATVLQGATIVLEASSEAPRIDLNVSEVNLSIEVLPESVMPDATIFIAEETAVDLIEVVLPGGGTGAPAPAPEYDKRVELASEDLAYRAEALPGAADTDLAWRVRRIEIDAAGEPVVRWAGGNPEFAYAWSDRAQLEYA